MRLSAAFILAGASCVGCAGDTSGLAGDAQVTTDGGGRQDIGPQDAGHRDEPPRWMFGYAEVIGL